MERKLFSPLQHKSVSLGISALAGISLVLYSFPILEDQEKSFDVYVTCQNSKPHIEVIGNTVVRGGVNWLVTEEVGSRRFRVLEKSKDSKKWRFNEVYPGFADPRSKYTEVPVGRFDFRQDKEYYFRIYSGDYSSRGTPVLDNVIHEERRKIPSC